MYKGSFSGVKRPGREFNHSPPPSPKVKSEWSYISFLPVCLHDVDGETSTSTFNIFL